MNDEMLIKKVAQAGKIMLILDFFSLFLLEYSWLLTLNL